MASSTASPAAASSAAPDCRRKKRSAGRQPPCLDAGGSTDRSPVMPARPNGLHFVALDSEVARALRGGAPDANGQAPERQASDGDRTPCPHCPPARRTPRREKGGKY